MSSSMVSNSPIVCMVLPRRQILPDRIHNVQYLIQHDYDVSDMDQNIELRHLRYFVAVAEELHFGRAAERLHLSQPPLSQQIRSLEESLGYPLFKRTSRSVALTTAGDAFLLRARRTLRNLQRDIEDTRSIGRGEVGALNVGFVGVRHAGHAAGHLQDLPGGLPEGPSAPARVLHIARG